MLGRIRGWVKSLGRRGAFLVFIAVLWLSTGTSWMQHPPIDTTNYYVIFQLAPATVWGALMTLIGLWIFASCFYRKMEDWAFGVSAAIAAVLGLGVAACYLPGVPGPLPIAPRVIAIYLIYAVITFLVSGWPDSAQPPNEHGDGDEDGV